MEAERSEAEAETALDLAQVQKDQKREQFERRRKDVRATLVVVVGTRPQII